jgi:hypothetical protein
MSRKNKVNPDHYKVAGRLSPDDLARERVKQDVHQSADAWHERERPAAPWTSAEDARPSDEAQEGASGAGTRLGAPRGARRSATPGGPATRSAKTLRTKKGGRTRKPVARKRGAVARAPKTSARNKKSAGAGASRRNTRATTKSRGARAAKKR